MYICKFDELHNKLIHSSSNWKVMGVNEIKINGNNNKSYFTLGY